MREEASVSRRAAGAGRPRRTPRRTAARASARAARSPAPKTSSTRLPRNSATVRALSLNATSTSRDTFSNSVRTKSAFTSACSRASTRVPISIASTITSARSSRRRPLPRQMDRHAVAHDERFGDDGVAEDGDAGMAEWGGGFHGGGVARYGPHLTERLHRSVNAREGVPAEPRPARATFEPPSPSGSSSSTSSRSTSARPGPPRHSSTSRSDGLRLALEHRLHGPVAAIGTQPDDAARSPPPAAPCRGRRRPARGLRAHSLADGHARYGRAMAAVEVLDTDITTLEVDAIANAANTELLHGGGVGRRDPPRRRPGGGRGVPRGRADRPRRGGRDDRRGHALPLGDPRRDDGAGRPDLGRHHPPRHRRHARAGRRARARSLALSPSARASAASRSTTRRGSRSRRSAGTSTPARARARGLRRPRRGRRAPPSRRRSPPRQ